MIRRQARITTPRHHRRQKDREDGNELDRTTAATPAAIHQRAGGGSGPSAAGRVRLVSVAPRRGHFGFRWRAAWSADHGRRRERHRSRRSEEQKSELQSLMRISYARFCLKKTKIIKRDIKSHYY